MTRVQRKPNHDVVTNPNHVYLVPKPKPYVSIPITQANHDVCLLLLYNNVRLQIYNILIYYKILLF